MLVSVWFISLSKADNLCQFLSLSLPHSMYVFLLPTNNRLYAELIYVRHLDQYLAHNLCYTSPKSEHLLLQSQNLAQS